MDKWNKGSMAAALPNLEKPFLNKNIITIKGKSYKWSDILCYKKHFDSIDEGKKGKISV